ncbi:hypothetical protein FQN57_003044 [Myotisia sp. PD_48]|nr:hypothetical protein FQN57_003044 [Myotisia sp. PD_48]
MKRRFNFRFGGLNPKPPPHPHPQPAPAHAPERVRAWNPEDALIYYQPDASITERRHLDPTTLVHLRHACVLLYHKVKAQGRTVQPPSIPQANPEYFKREYARRTAAATATAAATKPPIRDPLSKKDRVDSGVEVPAEHSSASDRDPASGTDRLSLGNRPDAATNKERKWSGQHNIPSGSVVPPPITRPTDSSEKRLVATRLPPTNAPTRDLPKNYGGATRPTNWKLPPNAPTAEDLPKNSRVTTRLTNPQAQSNEPFENHRIVVPEDLWDGSVNASTTWKNPEHTEDQKEASRITNWNHSVSTSTTTKILPKDSSHSSNPQKPSIEDETSENGSWRSATDSLITNPPALGPEALNAPTNLPSPLPQNKPKTTREFPPKENKITNKVPIRGEQASLGRIIVPPRFSTITKNDDTSTPSSPSPNQLDLIRQRTEPHAQVSSFGSTSQPPSKSIDLPASNRPSTRPFTSHITTPHKAPNKVQTLVRKLSKIGFNKKKSVSTTEKAGMRTIVESTSSRS